MMTTDPPTPSPKKRGRPPLEAAATSMTLNVRLSARQFDVVNQQALRDRISMAEVIRRAVASKGI